MICAYVTSSLNPYIIHLVLLSNGIGFGFQNDIDQECWAWTSDQVLGPEENIFIFSLFLYCVGVCSIYTWFTKGFYFFNHGWILNYIKCFPAYVEMIIWFLCFLLLMCDNKYFCLYRYIEPSLRPWDNLQLIITLDFPDVWLDWLV